jgi:hypothetical protein
MPSSKGKKVGKHEANVIPAASGSCQVSHARNRKYKTWYAGLLAASGAAFYFDLDHRLQHAFLALMFPGGGFIGLGGFWLIGFIVNLSVVHLHSPHDCDTRTTY